MQNKQTSGVNMLFKKITIMLAVFMTVVGTNLPATYYVDANSGNDANSGTSTSLAWKNYLQG